MLSTQNQLGVVERAQRVEADKHTAPVCDRHKVQFAACGCDGPTAGKVIREDEGEAA